MKAKPIGLSGHIPPLSKWVCLGYFDPRTSVHHAWLIAPEVVEEKMSTLPALARTGLNPEWRMATMMAEGVVGAMSMLHPHSVAGFNHFWHNLDARGQSEKMVWEQVYVGKSRAFGWGPERSLSFVHSVVMESYPEAIALLDMPMVKGRNPCKEYAGLLPQVQAIMDSRMLTALVADPVRVNPGPARNARI